MTLLRAANVSLSFGSRTLFKDVEFVIEAEERVGLVGVNGSGKSTLMKLLAGAQAADAGLFQKQRNVRISYLPQEPEFPAGATIESELTVAQADLKAAIDEHGALSATLDHASDERTLGTLSQLSERIDRLGGWDTAHEARKLLDRLGVREWDKPIAELSGGQKKRVAVARALLSRADLLMLDEPTNHLDADTIEWLEEELDAFPGAILLVTHDRYFLDGLVERIVEVTPPGSAGGGGLTSYPGTYRDSLEQQLAAITQAETAEHKRGRWIEQEVAWLRRGPQARRTKSKARIERARKLLSERGFQRPKVPALQLATAPRLSSTVIEAKHISKSFGTNRVFDDVSLILQPGERLAFLGKNGAGKTTLLRTLLGEIAPDKGTVTTGPRTRVAYYDQQRDELDDTATVYEAAWHDDWVTLEGNKVRLADYLEDLLFPVPMQRMKVSALSGGERNRLLLARLFLQGANVLVLDEPTNDLDLQTLNQLERLLRQFSGAVLLVTHDRYFLDKVATAILAFEGDGRVVRYEGNWETYQRLRPRPGVRPVTAAAPPPPAAAPEPSKMVGRLSYKDQRDFDTIEQTVAAAEAKKASLEAQLADPANASNPAEVVRLSQALAQAQTEVDALYDRWQQLQSKIDALRHA